MRMKKLVQNRLVLWWLASYLIILLISFMFGLLLYFRSSSVIEEEVSYSNQAILQQIRDNMDRKLSEIQKISFELKWDKDIQDINYYRAPLNSVQLYRISIIMQKLSVYATSNNIVEDIALYYPGSGSVVGTSSKYSPQLYFSTKTGFEEENIEKALQTPSAGIYRGTQMQREGGAAIRLLWAEPISAYGAEEEASRILIFLDEEELYNTLGFPTQNEETILSVVDADGEILFTNDLEAAAAAGLPGGVESLSHQGKNYIINSMPSEVNGWTYVFMMPREIYLKKLNEIAVFALWAAVLVGLTGVLAAILLSCLNYRPLRKTVDIVSAIGGKREAVQSDYVFIQQQISRIHHDNTILKQQLQTQEQLLAKNFLSSYISQGGPSDFPVLDIIAQYRLDLQYPFFLVVSFFFRGESMHLPTFDIKMELPLAVEQALSAGLSHVNAYFSYSGQTLTGCVNLGGEELEQLPAVLARLYESLSGQDAYPMLLAVSTPGKDIYYLPEAFEQTVRLYRSVPQRRNGVMFYQELEEESRQNPYLLSKELETGICNSLLMGNETYLPDFLEQQLFRQSELCPPGHFILIKAQLQSMLAYAMTQACAQNSRNASPYLERLSQLNDCKDAGEVVDEVRRQLHAFCTVLREQSGSLMGAGIEKRAAELVQEQYSDPQLSVYNIAQLLNVNPAYLSRAFKEKTGEVLSSYISRCRVEHAKELLQKGGGVADAASQTGFENTNTFIRSFKKYCGITPGRYKELQHRE